MAGISASTFYSRGHDPRRERSFTLLSGADAGCRCSSQLACAEADPAGHTAARLEKLPWSAAHRTT